MTISLCIHKRSNSSNTCVWTAKALQQCMGTKALQPSSSNMYWYMSTLTMFTVCTKHSHMSEKWQEHYKSKESWNSARPKGVNPWRCHSVTANGQSHQHGFIDGFVVDVFCLLSLKHLCLGFLPLLRFMDFHIPLQSHQTLLMSKLFES